MMHGLPFELLSLIFSHLKLPQLITSRDTEEGLDEKTTRRRQSIRTLFNISVTCKAYSEAVAPVLYRTFDQYALGSSNMRKFLVSIVRKPERALLLRELIIRETRWDPADLPVPAEVVDTISTFGLPEDNANHLVETFADRTARADIATILLLCPNIDILSVRFEEPPQDHISTCVFDLAESRRLSNARPHFLTHLDELKVVHSLQDSYTLPLHRGSKYVYLGSPATYHGWNLCPQLERFYSSKLLGASISELKHLYLHNTPLDGVAWRKVLSTCPRLKTLYISADESEGNFDWDVAGQALLEYGTSLETLELRYLVNRWSFRGSLGTHLPSLQSLKHLAVDIMSLFGADEEDGIVDIVPLEMVLPKYLQTVNFLTLILTRETDEYSYHLKTFTSELSAGSTGFPSLNKVLLDDVDWPP